MVRSPPVSAQGPSLSRPGKLRGNPPGGAVTKVWRGPRTTCPRPSVAVQPAQAPEEGAEALPEPVPQTRQPARRRAHYLLRPLPPRPGGRRQQRLHSGGQASAHAAQPTAHPTHSRTAALPRSLRTGARRPCRKRRLHRPEAQVPVGAQILRQQRMADPAPRAAQAPQRLEHTVEVPAVPAVAPQTSLLTRRIRAADLRHRLAHPLPVLLAPHPFQAYHGLLSEARRASPPIRQERREARRASSLAHPRTLRWTC